MAEVKVSEKLLKELVEKNFVTREGNKYYLNVLGAYELKRCLDKKEK